MTGARVAVVGAGLAGLRCARVLTDAGAGVTLYDTADAPGGRVRSDHLEGFTLDRGFQVLLTAYPEAQEALDYGALGLCAFAPGALVRSGLRFQRVADPLRAPRSIGATLRAEVGTLGDKLRLGMLRQRLVLQPAERVWERPETTTLQRLRELGFSSTMVDRFWRPFLGGIQLDLTLQTSSRMFEFVMRAFFAGSSVVPSAGMGALPAQLAQGLPPGTLRLGATITAVSAEGVEVAGGAREPADAVVIATDGPSAVALWSELSEPGSRSVACCYFAADEAPIDEPILLLDGESGGPVNNLACMSAVAPSYAPAGAALLSAAVVDDRGADDEELASAVRLQLGAWFGGRVDHWRHLRTYRIPHAQPVQAPPALSPPVRGHRLADRLYVCGDHRTDASINGALLSGRVAAEALLADLA